jgi:hypothetical protein
MSYHGETASQTLKNQTASNVEIRCRLEKTGKTGKPQQAGDTNPVTADPLKTISMGSIADGPNPLLRYNLSRNSRDLRSASFAMRYIRYRASYSFAIKKRDTCRMSIYLFL